ncbi:Synaptonemal complex protein 1 [Nibea albiflora]|uniref:Synaptonemal complex protein 1 n=1 Tax=Nibea albiflora TaxID=240163 RepID=A0ACB7F093_NIBAL|nr:Synaptonemal complex protein 1 [Nibea albiflora]
MPSPNISMVAPTKPTRQDFPKMKVVPPMEQDENNCNPGQLYSKLLDEVEKIKCWKIKVDADTVQKERRLQENKRTIETQRKAIHELQFGNESLSVKLEEQISENEDLRNKYEFYLFQSDLGHIRCLILMPVESEREETHHLFMENSENVQKLIAAFESLRVQAEAEQQEMQKVKEALLQFEDLKEKYHQEYNLKEKEVSVLQTKLKDTENELQKILLDFHEAQTQCKQLQEATDEQHELLRSSKNEQESLLQQLLNAEQRCEEAEKKCKAIVEKLEQNKEEYAEKIQSIDLNVEELTRVKDQQAERLEQTQTTNQELQNSLALETQRASELEDKLMSNNQELERTNTLLGETMEQSAKKDGQIKILEDELVQKLRLTAADAIKSKEDTELKCQRKIADMVALMEKYKSQYDRMAEEKDVEHDENKKKVMEAIDCQRSLELDLSKQRVDNVQLKQQLTTEVTEKVCPSLNLFILGFLLTRVETVCSLNTCFKENLQKELTDLKKEMTSLKMTQLSAVKSKQSYRIKTPPPSQTAHWGESTIELDPKSDSSDQTDLFIKCPVTHKSPGNSLKLAAIKRMRDAGWTAVIGCDKKKKKTIEKIFA